MKKMTLALLTAAIFAMPFTASISFNDTPSDLSISERPSQDLLNFPSVSLSANVAFADEPAVAVDESQVAAPEVAETPAQVSESDAPAEPTYFDAILGWFGASAGLITLLVGAFEAILRAFPSKKPLSLLVPIRYALVGGSKILALLADIADRLTIAAQAAQDKKATTVVVKKV